MVFIREMAWSDLQFHLLAQVRGKGLGEGKRGVGIVQTRDGGPGKGVRGGSSCARPSDRLDVRASGEKQAGRADQQGCRQEESEIRSGQCGFLMSGDPREDV